MSGIPRQALVRRIVLGLLIVGALFRVTQYAWRRSYWLDEAGLVLNILDKRAAEFLGPLDAVQDFRQAAPPLFLLVERGIALTLGESEYVLRLVPLTLSLASLVLFARLAHKLLPPAAVAWAIALFALSDRMIYHAAEAKPYASDVFTALALLNLAVGEGLAGRRLARVAALATPAAWFSYPAMFVFGGIALALAPAMLAEGRSRSPRTGAASQGPPPRLADGMRAMFQFVTCCTPVAVSVVVLCLVVVRAQDDASFHRFWAGSMPDYAHPLRLPLWLARSFVQLCNYPYQPAGGLVLALAIVGGTALAAAWRWEALLLTLAPLGLALLASLLQRYPFGGSRLTLFLAPGIFLLAGCGIARLGELAALVRWGRWWRLVPAGLVVLGMVRGSYHLAEPRTRSHIRPAVEYVRANRRTDEDVYVLTPPDFMCYWRQPDARVHLGAGPAGPRTPQRFWVVFSYYPGTGHKYVQDALDQIASTAVMSCQFEVPGGAAYLYERQPGTVPVMGQAPLGRPPRTGR